MSSDTDGSKSVTGSSDIALSLNGFGSSDAPDRSMRSWTAKQWKKCNDLVLLSNRLCLGFTVMSILSPTILNPCHGASFSAFSSNDSIQVAKCSEKKLEFTLLIYALPEIKDRSESEGGLGVELPETDSILSISTSYSSSVDKATKTTKTES